jgi:hypothetical protein
MHFREPGSSILFLQTYIFSFSYIFSFIIFFFILIFSLFSLIFYLLPLNSKLHCTYLLPHAWRLLVIGQRDDRDEVGTRKIFPLERYLKSSTLAPSCNLPWIDDPYSMICCGQGGKHKRWYFFVLRVDTGEVCEISDVGIHNARIERLVKREIRKNGMTDFLFSSQRNQAMK